MILSVNDEHGSENTINDVNGTKDIEGNAMETENKPLKGICNENFKCSSGTIRRKRITTFAASSDDSDSDNEIPQVVNDNDVKYNTSVLSSQFCSDSDSDDEVNTPKSDGDVKKLKKRTARLGDSSSESDDEDGMKEMHQSNSVDDVLKITVENIVAANSSGTLNELEQPQLKIVKSEDDYSSEDDSSLHVAACALKASEELCDTDNEDKSDEERKLSDDESCSSDSDDNDPPLRIFRNKNAAAMNARGFDNCNDLLSDKEDDEILPISDIPSKRKPRRSMPSNLEIKSETQRLIRESYINLPYFVPETKKLSEFLKRPIGFQNMQNQVNDGSSYLKGDVECKMDSEHVKDGLRNSGLGLVDTIHTDEKAAGIAVETFEQDTKIATTQTKKAKLLALHGVVLPELNRTKHSLTPQSGKEFVDLDIDEEVVTPVKEVSKFMERLLKQSKPERRSSLIKKKVQFNIVRKEERADGSGVDLVADVVTTTDSSKDDADALFCGYTPKYQTLRQKLAEKMKEKRSIDRKRREELYQLDNEEIGSDAEEEELEDEWSDIDSEEDEIKSQQEANKVDKSKNHIIEDDDDDGPKKAAVEGEDEENDATQPVSADAGLSNGSTVSKTSQVTAKSDILFPHLSSEGSMLLFDDTIKKSNNSHEEFDADQTFDPLYNSMIPPNQSEVLDISDSSKPAKLNFDEDSYFCSERSTNISTGESQSRLDCDSQFFDADGFIKEPKKAKPLSSLMPPGAEDDNANDCNMSQLLELCSGKFQDSGENRTESDNDDVAMIDESFGFQIEPAKFSRATSNGFSDEENDSSEDEGITIIRRKKDVTQKIVENFLEEEAELSGDDVGSDDDEDEDAPNQNYYEEEENDEVLPKDEVLQRQVNKVHLKQLLDEDQRDIELLQEAFVEDGIELRRNRKFKWRNIDENFMQDNFNSDDDENDCQEDDDKSLEIENEESQWRMLRLEREEFFSIDTNDETAEDESLSQLLKMGKAVIHRSRILSEINEDSRGAKGAALARSNSLTSTKLPSRHSFLCRKPEILEKFANFKESKVLKGAVNSNRMVFKAVSPNKKRKGNHPIKKASKSLQLSKKPKLDEDSNSVFDLFDS